jgi:succinate-semialdehyde dehydrogenase / glutarate-semialdehyde dehydrogenase
VDPRAEHLIRHAQSAHREVVGLDLDARLDLIASGRDAIQAEAQAIEDLAVAEGGQARRFARREVASALDLLDALPDLAAAIRPTQVPARSGTTTLEWAPYGVVFGWHSANSPIWVPTLIAASAFAGGNAVLARPSRRVGGTTALVLEALTYRWPIDAVQVVDLPPDDAEAMIAAPGVGAVVAHASTATCRRHMMRLARAYADGATMRPYIPEASGNDALVVLDGADMERAAAAAALGGFANAGQLCMAAKRIIVERRARDEFVPLLVEAVGDLVVGPADDEATDVAPLRPGPALTRARDDLAQALEAGGVVLAGGGERGGSLTPTVVLLPGPALGTRLWREESFAPLRGLAVADDARHAVRLANDSPYGLGAAVFGPRERARSVAAALRGSRITVNEGPLYQDAHLVVGGVGDSGMAGARPKVEQLVHARRVHVAAGDGN